MKTLNKFGFCLLSLSTIFASTNNFAAIPNWRGFYLGANSGAALAQFNGQFATQRGTVLNTEETNAVNNNGSETLTPNGFMAGVTSGYNWQRNRILLGLEADVSSLSINAATNSGAIASPTNTERQYVVSTYGNNNWLFTLRPRLGAVTNSGLLYLTGGLAVTLLQSDFLFTTDNGRFESKRINEVTPGFALGTGFETGLTDHVSMKLEYLYTYYSNVNAHNMSHYMTDGQRFTNSMNLRENLVRVGFNYHFDQSNSLLLSPQFIPMLFNTNLWQVELGVRPFYSSGDIGAPQPLFNDPGFILRSRLIYKNMDAVTLESYGRLDHRTGVFVKGLLGAGTILNGQLNDEDFPAGGAYSNTLSQASGNLSYATADAGYTPLKTATGNTGFFAGYNYYAQNVNVYNCRQLAGAGVCGNSSEFNNFLGISEDDTFQSLRVGVVTQFDLSKRVSLSTEAAYLPIVRFNGLDNHNARQLELPESSGSGDGSMLESTLTYQFSDNWNIGVGARYWMWNMHNGNVTFNVLGESGAISEPARFNNYRYGAFIQLNYLEKSFDHFNLSSDPVNWRGLYVGGNLGGAFGDSDWSDPYASTPGDPGFTNAAGFTNNIHVTGPLANLDAHYYWQNRLVYGIGANVGIADIRGDNTLFSGLCGVNGQITQRYLMTIVGRIGLPCERALYFVEAGPAYLRGKYFINANSAALTLGSQYQTNTQWGATFGAGIEYALTNHWTTTVGYNYIYLPSISMTYPEIALLNQQSYSVRQHLNVVKVGVDYKFG